MRSCSAFHISDGVEFLFALAFSQAKKVASDQTESEASIVRWDRDARGLVAVQDLRKGPPVGWVHRCHGFASIMGGWEGVLPGR